MQDQSWRAMRADAFERVLMRLCVPTAFAMVALTTMQQHWGLLIGWTTCTGAIAVARELAHRSHVADRRRRGEPTAPSRMSAEALVVAGWAAVGLVGLPLVGWWLPVASIALGVAAATPLVVRVHRDRETAAQVLLFGDRSAPERRTWVARLSDEELCTLWSSTSRRSLRRALRHAVEAYALVRGAVLDELESRDPAAFASWLEGGRPDDPAPYLARTSGSRPGHSSR